MNIPEEFGKYLLLKKLTEDPLGETFRAGKIGKDGMEQVILLRVFNGKGVDGEKLWQKASGRANVQQALKSPNIGSGVDLGRVRSFPYAAYDYISGKNLAVLLAQANRQLSPIPTDHALLVAERIALALAAAHETKVQDERILHGFLVPQLVMISNEGETRLLGFEFATGLRSLASAGWQDPEVRPYLSPETFEGAAPSKADDVFSLGAILFELLTGERLPVASSDVYAAKIDSAMLANEGTPLPPAIAGLLKKSLTVRDQRISDAVTWHKTMSKLMIDGHFSPTTFNLAFFMHNLFRDEIERENQEIQAEKKLELPKKAAEPAPAAAVTAGAAAGSHETKEVKTVRETTLSGTRSQFVEKKSNKGLWIGLAAALLVAAGVGGYLMMSGGKTNTADQAAAPSPATVPAAQPAAMPGGVQPAAVPAGPTPEELQAQIQAMIAAQSKEAEERLKGQYDDQIQKLQKQLEESRKAAAEQERMAQQPARQPERQAPAPVQATPEPEPETRVAKAEPTPAPVIPAPTPEPQRTEPVQQAAAPQPTPAPVVRKTQFGDLVQAGPGVTAPKVTLLDPRYPAAAQRLNKAATVDIRVLVDENGRVVDAQRAGAKAGFGFDEAALEAARRAQFNPATKDGVRVKMWYTLRVAFQPGKR